MTKTFLYCITNQVNGKQYIGITNKGIDRRFIQHLRCAQQGYDYPLYRSIRKHGAANFKIEELNSISDYKLAQRAEQKLIVSYGTLSPLGYNLSSGGRGCSGFKLSEESKLKISIARKKSWMDPEYRKNYKKGVTEAFEKTSRIWKEKWLDPEFRKKQAEGVIKAKAKQSDSACSRWADPVYHARVVEAQRLGRERKKLLSGPTIVSDETRAKISRAANERHNRKWAEAQLAKLSGTAEV